jgi:hypothetical protein
MSVASVQQLGDVLQAASEPVRQLSGALRRCWNYRKCGAFERRFPLAKQFLRKLSAVLPRASRNVHKLRYRSKTFKEYLFEGAPN